MPFTDSQPPPLPVPSRPKTERGAITKSRSSRKRLPRSAPAVFQSSVIDPVTPASLFLPLTIKLDDPQTGTPGPPSPSPPPTHFECIARLAVLVADSTLTAAQSTLLDAAMNTAQLFVPPAAVHSLLQTIASPMTTPSEILQLALVTDAGMRAFVARPGPRHGSRSINTASSGSNSSRNDLVKTACATRDNSTCVVTGKDLGLSCHIIPFSVRGEKANNFWAFVAMFKGPAETQRLKTLVLGYPPTTDCVRNVLWLSPDTHVYFDAGKLAIIPTITTESYDPTTATEYTARIELPYGPNSVKLHVWSSSPTDTGQSTQLTPGQTITLRTSDPILLPLPHPILLQLHAAFTRLRKMSAAAGVPILPDPFDDEDEDDDMALSTSCPSEVDYQERVGDDDATPRFRENDQWPKASGGLPLKKCFLQLLSGAEDSEFQQYYRAIDRWSPGAAVLRGKRPFELFARDASGSGSEESHPATELARRKRRWDGIGGRPSGGERESASGSE